MGLYETRARVESRAAHEIIAAHVADPESQQCRVCLTVVPCPSANAAANRLVELGLPVLDPVPPLRRSALRRWLALHRRGRTQPAPLLSRAWRWRLGAAVG
ncbi:hypothetical protein OG271_11385 [Micromonospora rifamycinica]|uniref:hypothetical protein n=1 Tax=Micromonospora rifamycinica TaxID=291594 RepID=UPI002E2C9FAB|nr:hypothetical protein [Micromonospora rifamycinica]